MKRVGRTAAERAGPSGGAAGAVGRRAVVIGSGMAGLFCARVLAPRFGEVVIVERDTLSGDVDWRRRVPQGRHQHVLLAEGARLLEGWFPGLGDELHERGAVEIDVSRDFYWHRGGGVWRAPSSGLYAPSLSRPCLEAVVRERVAALPGVTIRDRTSVDGIDLDTAGQQVRGVRLDDGTRIEGDLVVDATGRQGRSFEWLAELGYPPPPSSVVRVDIRYVTQVYARTDLPSRDWKAAFVIGTPASRQLAAAVPFEGDRWFVLLGGVNGEMAPTDREAAIAYARSLASPVVAEVMESSEPIGEPVTFRFPSNQRRHVERLRRFPTGWLPVGDAVCTFNPLYGQGMTCAARQAQMMAEQLDRSGTVSRSLSRRYFRGVARQVAGPWKLAVGGDFAYPDTEGPKPPGTDRVNRYLARATVAAQRDDEVSLRLRSVAALAAPPASLLTPGVVRRVLRASRQGPTGSVRLSRSEPASADEVST